MKQQILKIMLLLMALWASPCVIADEQWAPRPEDVTVIQAGKTVMYKFRDAEGNMIVQGQPPRGFLNPRVVEEDAVSLEEVAPVMPEPKVEAPAPAEKPPPPDWPLTVLLALCILLGVVRRRLIVVDPKGAQG